MRLPRLTMPYYQSTYENGRYENNKWFCACNREPVWRRVSKEGPTKGQQFLRCTGRSGEQCSFFLWDEHEPTALKKLAARTASQSPILLTPTSSISTPSTAYYIPTAGTLTPTSTVPTRNRRLQLMDQESPTRRLGKDVVAPPLIADDIQYKDEHESDNDSDEEDSIPLLSEILDRFKADGIRLKLSTKEFLREILGERFAIYDAELRTKKDSITRLSRKLDRLTVK